MYEANWDSLDKRPLPEWFRENALGIMVHWGVYSVPGFCVYQENAKIQNGAEWYLRRLKNPQYAVPPDKEMLTIKYHQKNYKNLEYYDFGEMFTAAKWDPDEWADLFKKSGAKYVVITSKHHDGFTLFPHKTAKYRLDKTNKIMPWNSVEIGPKRDIVGDLQKAVTKVGLKFGVYYSLLEWYPFTQKDYVMKVHAQIKYLIETYSPEVLWLDGHWQKTAEDWKIQELLAWIYNVSPVKDTIVVNDRLGKFESGKHGDFYNFQDRFIPDKKIEHKWECVIGVSKGWGYNKLHKHLDWKSPEEINELYQTVKKFGGNLLLNIGPDSEGVIPPQELLILSKLKN
ncbi:MAG: putative alpha-L-fucosidase [Harvfovirus sp.]|uniref:alpha-L-fucosidase n=1 Tax=Harvfovirus sp. TaxID=2487768 RepID=A0A3G5A3G2_9VIRU|nr:MAG: putative alpha-L-fucosidase [Harvfovirus sp.]